MNSVASNLLLAKPLFEKIGNILDLTGFCGVFGSSSHFKICLYIIHENCLTRNNLYNKHNSHCSTVLLSLVYIVNTFKS